MCALFEGSKLLKTRLYFAIFAYKIEISEYFVKLLLPISLILFCSIHQWVHSKAAIGPVSSKDTIIRLEKRVELNLANIQNTIDEANSKLEIFRTEISRLDYDRKQLKRTKIRAAKIQDPES